jgi:hypothetical protein
MVHKNHMNIHNFTVTCIQNAQHSNSLDNNKLSTTLSETQGNEDVSCKHYTNLYDEDVTTNSLLDYQSALADSITWQSQSRTPSLASQDSLYISSDDYKSDLDNLDTNIEETSLTTIETINQMRTNGCSDHLPKTFLQLKGISVANYNMGCDFSIAAAL